MLNDQLWAPWRLAYVQSDKKDSPEPGPPPDLRPGADPTCFLCQAVGCHDDRSRGVVHRGTHWLTVLNRFPYNNGHLLVAPLDHCERLDQLAAEVQLDLVQTVSRMVAHLENVLHPQGFNIGLNLGRVAGAGLPGHLHWHVVPRWNGDTNFMPVLGGVNVIPQSLDALWEMLTRSLAGNPA